MTEPFTDPREAARALIVTRADLDWRSGQFAGGIAYIDRPLTSRQRKWLAALLAKASLPPLVEVDA